MKDLEYMINYLISKPLDRITNDEIIRIIDNYDLRKKRKVLNKIIENLRIKRKELMRLKDTLDVEQLDEIYLKLKKINKCSELFNRELIKIKRETKNIDDKELEGNNNEVVSEISQIMKLINNYKQLIKLYSKLNINTEQMIAYLNSKIGDLNKFFTFESSDSISEVYIDDLINLFFEQILINMNDKDNFKLKEFRCLILQIKQIYIGNINLYNDLSTIFKSEIKNSKKMIQNIDEIIIQIRNFSNIKITSEIEKDYSSNEEFDLNNILFKEVNYEKLSNLLNDNPSLCLTTINEKFVFENYLEYVKNRIINSDMEDKAIRNLVKKILLFLEIIEKNNYLELKNIYNKYLYDLSNLIIKLDNKNFDLNKLEQIKLFLNLINIEKIQKNKVNDFDKFLKIISEFKKKPNYNYYYDYIITIDNDDAKLLDTAYSFKQCKDGGYEFGIYVKDVSEILDKIDLNKIYNQFIRNKKIFDSNFALDKLSLSAVRTYHKVLGHHFKLDRNFQVEDFKIKKEMINVTSNLNYTDITNIIKSNKNTKILDILKIFHKCGNNIIDSERKYSLYKVNGIDRLNHNIMLFFNYYMASFCKENNIPSIFLTNTYSSNYTVDNIPYGKYSCPARNFTSLINQIIYGIWLDNNISDYKIKKIIEILENYAINLNYESHDYNLKKAKKKELIKF